MANITVSVTDANNITVQLTPVASQTITIDRGVAGNGISSIVPVTISTLQYLRIYYTNGTQADVGPLTSTAYFGETPITIVGNTISLSTVPINKGGTNAITAAAAIQNLLPSYTGNGSKRLGLNSGATALEWVADGGGTVTSVDVSGGTTGLTTSGGPITGSGTITLAGTLALANGGTGQTTAAAAITALTGTQTSGYYLRSNGTNAVLAAISAADVPTLNQNTTGTAAGLSATLAVASGGTGVTTSTGTGSVVLSTSPSLVTPLLGTPTSGDFSTGTFTWPTFNQNTTGTAAGLSSTLVIASGGTNSTATPTAGAVPYGTGTAYAFTAAGTAGQILQSNGASAPTWANLSSLGVSSFSAGTTGFTPSTATTGAVTLAGTLNAVNGGTGQSSYAVGDLLYASTTTALSKLADVATGNTLISGGVSTAPSWGKIGLTTHVSGTLPTANGGTNLTSFTSGGVVYASSTSALTTGSALVFDGTNLGVGAGNIGVASGKGFVLTSTPTTGMFPDDQFIGLKLQTAGGIRFFTNSTESARIDSSGNLLLAGTTARQRITVGTTTVSSTSTPEAIDLGATYSNTAGQNLKVYTYNDGTIKHGIGVSTGSSDYLTSTSGKHSFYTGTTASMTLFASGGLGLGTTSDPTNGHLAVGPDSGKTGSSIVWTANTGGRLYVGRESSAGGTIIGGTSAYAAVVGTNNAYPLQFGTNNAVRATIDSSGNFLVGSSSTIGTGGVFQVTSGLDTSIFKCTSATAYAAIVANVEATNARLIAFQYGSGASPTNVGRITTDGTNIALANVSGITFPATQSASTDANTLDDYEEGTCTFVLSDSSGNNATMGSPNVFRYIKIGRMVSVSGTLAWDSVTGVTTSRTRITGLPFAAASVNSLRFVVTNGSSAINSFNITRSEIAFGIDFNNAFIWGTKVSGNNLDNNLTISDFGSSGVLYGLSFIYYTDT